MLQVTIPSENKKLVKCVKHHRFIGVIFNCEQLHKQAKVPAHTQHMTHCIWLEEYELHTLPSNTKLHKKNAGIMGWGWVCASAAASVSGRTAGTGWTRTWLTFASLFVMKLWPQRPPRASVTTACWGKQSRLSSWRPHIILSHLQALSSWAGPSSYHIHTYIHWAPCRSKHCSTPCIPSVTRQIGAFHQLGSTQRLSASPFLPLSHLCIDSRDALTSNTSWEELWIAERL